MDAKVGSKSQINNISYRTAAVVIRAVGAATGYGLDSPGFEIRLG